MKKKPQGVGSILRKSEEREECSLKFKLGEPTHKIRKIKIADNTVIGYIEAVDKSTVKIPIKKLEAPLFFGVGNEEYVAHGLQEDLIKADKVSCEIREEIEKAIEEAKLKLAPRISNGKVVSIDACENKGE